MLRLTKLILFLLTIFFLFIIYSCDRISQNENPLKVEKIDNGSGLQYPDFIERNIGLGNVLNDSDTLKILIQFSDCGEWGGHRESIFLQRNQNNEASARFTMDSVSCSNIKNYGNYAGIDDNKRIILIDKTKILTNADEKLMNIFLHRLLELYLNQEDLLLNDSIIPIYKNSGSSIQVINSNNTLNFIYINWDEMANTWYGKVRKEIFGGFLDFEK